MGLTGNACEVVAGQPGPRHRSMRDHAVSPELLRAPLGPPKAPWEVQWDHTDLSAQRFCVTLAAGCASKPPLNKWVEASGSQGHLRLANHPWSGWLAGFWLPQLGLGVFCGHWLAGMWLAGPSSAADLAHCEMGEKVEELLCRRVWP